MPGSGDDPFGVQDPTTAGIRPGGGAAAWGAARTHVTGRPWTYEVRKFISPTQPAAGRTASGPDAELSCEPSCGGARPGPRPRGEMISRGVRLTEV
jgi:hypothetical protein